MPWISSTSGLIRQVSLSRESLICVLDSAHDCLESSNETAWDDGSRQPAECDDRPAECATTTRPSATTSERPMLCAKCPRSALKPHHVVLGASVVLGAGGCRAPPGGREQGAKSKNYQARNAKKIRSNVPESRAPRLYSASHCRLSRQAVSFPDQSSPGAHGGESDVEAARGAAAVNERPG